MSDSPPEFERLRRHGTEQEQSLLGSADEDRPSAAARNAALAHVVSEHRAQRRRALGIGLAAVALAAAAALPLLLRHEPQPMPLTAEPHTSVQASSRALSPSPSGASPFVQCTPLAVATGESPLIDDFEDGDAHVPAVEQRIGQWLIFNDGTGTQFPRPGTADPTRIVGGRGPSHFARHSAGGKFSKWGASLSFEFNPRHCYDASAYGGLEFWARGRGEIRLIVKMTQVIAEEFGGSCSHDCYDGHAKRIKLSRDFQHFVVRWSELSQTGFGTPLAFDARSLDAIDFSVLPEETPFDFWIDDVSFIPR